MKAWLFIFILVVAGILSILRLLCRIKSIKKGKEKKVREEYAAESVALLLFLAMDIVTVIGALYEYSFWDFLGDIFHIRKEESEVIPIVGIISLVVIFVLCYRLVAKTYGHWNGPVSRRQHAMNTEQMENGKLSKDFFYYINCMIRGMLKGNPELRRYISIADEEIEENSITNESVWKMEFAMIYSLMSNQAHIDVEKDWHSMHNCFVSEYASKKIAIFCTNQKPEKQEVIAFLEYIHTINPDYFRIIVAVKNGMEKDFKEWFGMYEVEYIFKENALDHLVDFSEYYRVLNKLYNQPVMSGSSARIADIYVEPKCRVEKTKEDTLLKDYVMDWLMEKSNRHLALLGDFGQGKTVFATRLCHEMIQEKHQRVPILISLRNKSPRNSTKEEILSYFGVQYGINAKALDLLNRNGRLLLVFDGFDEMDLVGTSDIRLRHFRSIWTLACPGSKILITGRSNYFLSREEMVKALSFQADKTFLPYCEELHLLLFNEKQIMEALRNAPETVQKGISHILKNKMSMSFSDLIRRPSHLFLISLIWDERELEKKYRNLTSAAIINEFLQSCFERQAQKSSETPYFYLSPVEREYFMTGIAVRMYKMGNTVISKEVFQDVVQDLTEVFPERLSYGNPVNMNLRNGESVKAFVEKDDDSLLAVINDVRSCGVLVNDNANNGLAFAHKSFFDLLVAKFFAGRLIRGHNQDMLIADSIASINSYNIKLKNDFVVRKLTAELISTEAAANVRQSGCITKCRKMYDQCYRIIFRYPFVLKPQLMLRLCLNQQKRSRLVSVERWNRGKESKRVLLLFGTALICMVIFLIRAGQIMLTYQNEVEQFSKMYSRFEGVQMPVLSVSWIMIMLAVILTAAGALVSALEGKAEISLQNRADIMMLTWYYSCLDNHISEKEILRTFPKKMRRAFLNYVDSRSLNNLSDE